MGIRLNDSPLPPVVIIDDSQNDHCIFEHKLKKAGLQNPIIAAGDGSEAVAIISELLVACPALVPALVFTDINMPKGDGFETTQLLRAQPPLAHVPVVLLSGLPAEKDVERARSVGAVGVLEKFPPAALLRDLAQVAPEMKFL